MKTPILITLVLLVVVSLFSGPPPEPAMSRAVVTYVRRCSSGNTVAVMLPGVKRVGIPRPLWPI